MKKNAHWSLIALCTALLFLPAMSCPNECVCKWKNGKRYVECIEKSLKRVPSEIDSETQVLDFAGNDLETLERELFQILGLLDLQKIYLQRCRIHKIDNHAFKGLANLVELDLSNNFLTVVPSANFLYFPSLMRLSMNNNPITSIKTQCFHNLMYLNTLEMSECKIEEIEENAFSGLRHLEWLRLDGNKIATIMGSSVFPETLKGIHLENNRWHCDCNMIDLREWLIQFNMPHTVEPVCSTPERLWKKKIITLSKNDLACPPKMTPTSVYLETNEGSNVTLECMVRATPEAGITWRFQGHPIQNDSVNLPGFKTSYSMVGINDKKSELYIFHVSPDDNGTYTCVAENIAGRVQGNYTLKIIVKEEPVIVVVTFPRKHLVIIVTGVFLIIVLIIAIVAVTLLKFKTDTKSKKKITSGKDVVLHDQSIHNSDLGGINSLNQKLNGSVLTNAQTHHVVHYTLPNDNDTYIHANHIKNMIDRNPDLVNDTGNIPNNMYSDNSIMSVYKTHSPNTLIMDDTSFSLPTMPRQVTWKDQQALSVPGNLPPHAVYNMYQHSVDVHLNPDCYLDNDGYPYDYGLPKVQCRSNAIHSNYSVIATPGYQTLPHNRNKPPKMSCKFSKDTEFNSPHCFNHATNNFRHTVDGYPVVQSRQNNCTGNGDIYISQATLAPSPPDAYKEPIQVCCAGSNVEACSSWSNAKGTCAVMVPIEISDNNKCYHVETRCVDTQTVDLRQHFENSDKVKPSIKALNQKCELEVCTESPDEGYVGEAIDSNDT